MDENLTKYVPAVSFDPPMVRPVMIPHRRGKYVKFADVKESLSKSHNNVRLPRSCKTCILKNMCDAEYAMGQCWHNAVKAHFA
jgi:hypothetical protein